MWTETFDIGLVGNYAVYLHPGFGPTREETRLLRTLFSSVGRMTSSPLLDVLSGKSPERRPIWFMRQAGRYLPEYRALRQKAGSFLDLCYAPDLATEVTLQPLHRYDVDAAILFSDILVVPHAMGVGLKFAEGEGPVLEKVLDAAAVRVLKPLRDSDQVSKVCGTVERVRSKLEPGRALIGFCGAPWTVASYMIEGGGSDREIAKRAAFEGPPWFRDLIAKLVEQSIVYLSAQVDAGAQALQLFDSWAGDLAGEFRMRWVDEPMAAITKEIRRSHPGIPVIAFARGVGISQGAVAEATGAQAVGIEAEMDIADAARIVPASCAIQGNLDPIMLLADEETCLAETRRIAKAVPKSRHIFNLGHGIRQTTDPARLAAVIAAVRECDA
jgi:uroporphyrinogen decarboxylase